MVTAHVKGLSRLGRVRRAREKHPDGCSGTDVALRLHRAAVGFHEMFDDGEPKPGAPRLARASGVGAVESLEDSRQVLKRNATAAVTHVQRNSFFDSLRLDCNVPRRCMSESIFDEVEQYLFERGAIRINSLGVRRDRDPE